MTRKLDIARRALEDIVDPAAQFIRNLEPGEKLDGLMVAQLHDDAAYLRELAKDALKELDKKPMRKRRVGRA